MNRIQSIRRVFTIIAVALAGIITGFFLDGGVPSFPTGLQQYGVQTTTSQTVTIMANGKAEWRETTTVTTTETTPHGYFHNFAAALVPANAPITADWFQPPGADQIWAINREFVPASITVPVGTTVTWINKDAEDHTVKSDNGLFNFDLAYQGASDNYTFTVPGTFTFYCEPHPQMTGKVIVK
jgi:plastocyanin